jgi:hypothetical protein
MRVLSLAITCGELKCSLLTAWFLLTCSSSGRLLTNCTILVVIQAWTLSKQTNLIAILRMQSVCYKGQNTGPKNATGIGIITVQ